VVLALHEPVVAEVGQPLVAQEREGRRPRVAHQVDHGHLYAWDGRH
jgi:hypothetical protein